MGSLPLIALILVILDRGNFYGWFLLIGAVIVNMDYYQTSVSSRDRGFVAVNYILNIIYSAKKISKLDI